MEPEINQFYRRTPLQFKLYTPPLELAAKALEMSQRRYDTNFSAAIKAKQAMINALPGDQPVANAWRQENSKLINDAIKKSNGDYSQITQALQGLEMKLADDMAPGSKYFQINKNANDYQSWYKANQDNKDIDPENLSGYSSHFLKNYTPVGDADPSKGYQPLNLPKLPKMTDWFGDVDKSMASLKDEKFMRDITVNNPDLSTTRTQVEQSGVSKDRAFNVGMAKLMSDPYYRADRQFKAQFMSPEELVAQDRANVLRMAEGAAHATDSQSVSYGKNDNAWAWKNYGLAAQDNALARDRLDWEKDKDRRDNAPDPGEGQFSYTGYVQVPQTTLAEQGLSLSKVMSPEGQPVKKSISEAWNESKGFDTVPGDFAAQVGNLIPRFMQGALKRGVGEEKFVKSEDVMKGNPKLKAVWDSKFNGATFDPNNKEHVKLADEAQFEYDQAVKKKDGRDVIVQRFGNANAKAMGEAAYRAFSAGVKTSAVWDKTKPGLPQFEAGTAKDIRTLIQDGNVKPSDFQAVGVISAAQGLGQGHQLEVTVKGKTYLMQLDDVATNPYTKAVADAYGSVLNSQIDGGLIPTQSYDANKNPIFAQPIIRYEKGNFVNDMKAFFMSPDREYHPMPSNPKDYNGNPITYQTIFDNIENPVIQSYLPLVKGADKFGTSPLPR